MHSKDIGKLAAALAVAQSRIKKVPSRKIEPGRFYVYAHLNKELEVLYIGKGTGKRIKVTGSRNAKWKEYFKRKKYYPLILAMGLTEEEAYQQEIQWISFYRHIGEAKLNIANGGVGVTVDKRWWGGNISKGLKMADIKRPKGKDHPSYKDYIADDELIDLYLCKKLSATKIGKLCGLSYSAVLSRLVGLDIKPRFPATPRKKIKCITDGNVFNSITEAARFYKLHRENIRKVLKGKYKHTGNKVFIYV